MALAILPNGEAVRPAEVVAVRLEPCAHWEEDEVERFNVVLALEDGAARVIGAALVRADAADLGRRCARAINDALRG